MDQRGQNAVPGTADVIFLEIDIIDTSNFEGTLDVHRVDVDGHRILRVESPAAPNAIAAILLALRDTTGVIPNSYFEWSEGNPLAHLMRYLLWGEAIPLPSCGKLSASTRRIRPDALASTWGDDFQV